MAWEAEIKFVKDDLQARTLVSEQRIEVGEGQRFVAIKMLEGEVWIPRDEIAEITIKNATPVAASATGL